jgi:hypothetical protein
MYGHQNTSFASRTVLSNFFAILLRGVLKDRVLNDPANGDLNISVEG